jgi:hypothetical protein
LTTIPLPPFLVFDNELYLAAILNLILNLSRLRIIIPLEIGVFPGCGKHRLGG